MGYKKPKIKLKFLSKLKYLVKFSLFFILILIAITLPILSLFYIGNYLPKLSKEISNQTLGFLALVLYFTIANLLFIKTKIKDSSLLVKIFSSHPSTSERIKYIENYPENPNEIKKK